jgi:hypothetical protein
VEKILLIFWTFLMSLFGVITEYFEKLARFCIQMGRGGELIVLAGSLEKTGLFSWTQVIIAAQ